MVEAVVLAGSKPFRHRLDTLAVTGADEPGYVKRTHLTSFLVTKLVQKRLQKCRKFPIPICHVAPPNEESTDHLKSTLPESAKVVLDQTIIVGDLTQFSALPRIAQEAADALPGLDCFFAGVTRNKCDRHRSIGSIKSAVSRDSAN